MASAQLFRSQLCAVLPFVALVWAVKAAEMDPEWPPAPPFLPHFRPGFHIPQPNGLQMHDPSGNIQLPDGTYHVFTFPDWKHYSSTDLAHWEAQNNTAIPGSTGSSTVRQDGSIVGVTAQGDVTLFLAQDNATCVGGSCLSNWSVLSPSAARAPDDERLTSAGFRDPSRPFRGPDGRWYMIVGGGEAGVCARALVFQSRDETLTNFTYSGVLLSANHTASAGDAAGFFDMFECPDFFPMLVEGSKGESQTYFVFISSCYLSAQDPYPKYGYHNAVSYWIGRWSPTDSEDGNSSGEVALDIVARGVLDWGKVGYYSAKSMGNAKLDQVSKVRLMGGWVLDSSGASEPALCKNGGDWASCPEALHRIVWICENKTAPTHENKVKKSAVATPALCQAPAPQLQVLRADETRKHWSGSLAPGAGGEIYHRLDSSLQLEVRATFRLESRGSGGPQDWCGVAQRGVGFGIRVLASTDGAEATDIGFDCESQSLFVDRSRSSLLPASLPNGVARNDTGTQGYGVRSRESAPLRTALAEREVRLVVILDHSVLYVFANEVAAITTRIYTRGGAASADAGLFVTGNQSTASVQVDAELWRLSL